MGKLYVIYRDRGSTESCHDAEQLLHQSLQHITDSEFIHADISNYAEIFNRILQENDEGGLLIVDAGDRFAADYVEKLWHVLKNSNAAYISGRKSFIWMDKTVANKLLLSKKQLEMMPYTDILAGTLVNIKMAKGLALQGHLGGDMEADFLMRLAMKHTVEIQELLDYEYSQPDASQFQCYQGVYFKEWYFESMTDFLIPQLPAETVYYIQAIMNLHDCNYYSKNYQFNRMLLRIKYDVPQLDEQYLCERTTLCIIYKENVIYLLNKMRVNILFMNYVDGRLEIDASVPDHFSREKVAYYFRLNGVRYDVVFNEGYSLTKYFGVSAYKRFNIRNCNFLYNMRIRNMLFLRNINRILPDYLMIRPVRIGILVILLPQEIRLPL